MPKKKEHDVEEKYPTLAEWVSTGGWIEIGTEYNDGLFARALDEGGMAWEGTGYDTLDEAMQALNAGIGEWIGK